MDVTMVSPITHLLPNMYIACLLLSELFSAMLWFTDGNAVHNTARKQTSMGWRRNQFQKLIFGITPGIYREINDPSRNR